MNLVLVHRLIQFNLIFSLSLSFLRRYALSTVFLSVYSHFLTLCMLWWCHTLPTPPRDLPRVVHFNTPSSRKWKPRVTWRVRCICMNRERIYTKYILAWYGMHRDWSYQMEDWWWGQKRNACHIPLTIFFLVTHDVMYIYDMHVVRINTTRMSTLYIRRVEVDKVRLNHQIMIN